MVLQMATAASALSSPMVCAFEPRSTAQSRHHVMSAHHPISCADVVELRDATHHLCSSPAHRRRASSGVEPPSALENAHERGCRPRGRRRDRVICTRVRAPRSRCWAFMAVWRLMVAPEGWIFQPSAPVWPRPLICGRVVSFGASGSAWEAVEPRNR